MKKLKDTSPLAVAERAVTASGLPSEASARRSFLLGAAGGMASFATGGG
jgi:hypothetical protein